MLGIPRIAQGTGEKNAAVTYTTFLEWDLYNQVAGISFDTTASNTGLSDGSCMLLEQKLQKELLWFACRHHVLELICGAAFKAVFGPTTAGPNVPLFRRFQEFWPAIDQTSYTSCSDKRLTENLKSMKANAILFASEALTKSFPREDYRELLELTLIFLGETPPRGVSFRSPGAFHHARWMSKILYTYKLYLFQEQFHMTKRESSACLEFCMFVSLVYAKAWTTSTNACDAPLNDLELFKACHKYSSTSVIISKAATSTLGRHLWYLGEELVTLSLFSDKVPKETKQAMVCRLRDFNKQSSQLNSTRSRRSCDVDII